MAKTIRKSSKVGKQKRKFQLVDLFLVKTSASREGVRGGSPPPHVTINVQVHVGTADELTDMLGVLFEIAAAGRYEPEGDPAITIYGQYKVVYKFNKPIDKLKVDTLAGFSQQAGLLHVWPYWRELVQSTTSKMGLPVLRMPLLFGIGVKGQTVTPSEGSKF